MSLDEEFTAAFIDGYPIGPVLMAAGMFDWTRRFRGQPKAEPSRSVPSTNPPQPDGPDPGTKLMLIRWDSSFECGHPVIDMQHRELFNISNVLINSVMERKPRIGTEKPVQKSDCAKLFQLISLVCHSLGLNPFSDIISTKMFREPVIASHKKAYSTPTVR